MIRSFACSFLNLECRLARVRVWVCLVVISFTVSLLAGTLAAKPSVALSGDLYFKRTGLPSVRETEYHIDTKGLLTKVVRSPSRTGTKRSISQRQISEKELAGLQKRLSAICINEWRREYETVRMDDGYFWSMRFVAAGKETISKGRNAGPDPLDPSKTLDIIARRRSGDLVLFEVLERMLSLGSQ